MTRNAAGARAIASAAIAAAVLAGSAAARTGHKHPGHHHPHQGQEQSGPIGGSKHGPSARFSRRGIAASGAWRGYVLDSPGPEVNPASVDVQNTKAGNTVDNPAGLSAADGSVTTFNSTGPNGPYEVVDLGRLTGGRIEIGVAANTGTPIQLAYSEARRFLGPGGDVDHGSQGRSDDPSTRSDIVPGTPGNYTLGGVRGAERYIYIQLAGAGNAQIDYIRVEVTHLRPAAGHYVGHFLSSDDLLNRIWYAGAYTLNVDTYGDPARGNNFAVTDGAKHDRLVWLGDLPIESLAGFYTVRELPIYLRRSIQMFTCQQVHGGFIPQVSEVNVQCREPGPANGPPPSAFGICTCVTAQRLPSYTAWFVVGAAQYYRMTADPRVAGWLPVVQRAIRYFQKGIGPRGLFVTQQGELNWHPPDLAAGEDADTNSVWVRALQSASTLEKELGNPHLGRRYAGMSRRLAAAIRAALFDPSVGALRLNTADPTGNHTQDANVQAILAGVLRGPAAGSALNFLGGTLATPFGTATGQFDNDPYMGRYISPFESGWEVLARLQYYQTGEALGLIRRLWGHMVFSDPGDTLWEKMTVAGGVSPYQSANPNGSPIIEDSRSGETSLAHGWSAGPTAALSAYVLGMRPASPGWKTWLVEPQPGDLKFAQGSVGTPVGKLGVRWERDMVRRHSFRITVKAPHGATGTVAVPLLGAKRTIGRDGRIVWAHGHPVGGARARRAGNYVRFDEPEPGVHTYAWAVGKKK
ncbi:MAG: alpha-L-rhamnosidase C-terminal domain-containing protein [Actinomycetota bacterium]